MIFHLSPLGPYTLTVGNLVSPFPISVLVWFVVCYLFVLKVLRCPVDDLFVEDPSHGNPWNRHRYYLDVTMEPPLRFNGYYYRVTRLRLKER